VAAIVGYFDVKKQLPETTLKTMLSAAYMPSACNQQAWQTEFSGLGVVAQKSDATNDYDCAETERIVMTGEFESLEVGGGMPRLDRMTDQQVALLRGGFVWALMDESQQRFFIVNDHFGRHPLYIVKYKEAVLFATQIKVLLAALPVKPELDKQAVAMMLSIGEMVGNQTLVSGIKTLAAGSVLSIDAMGMQQHQYWQYSYQQDFSKNKKQAITEIGSALEQSVHRAVKHSDTLTVPLSGGLDSRFILGLANKEKQVHAYTWGVPGCRDLIYAKKTSQKINCTHDLFEFSPNYLQDYADKGVWITEGQIPVVNFHVLPYVERLAEDGNLTLLDGYAGDVAFGGNFIQSSWMNNSNESEVVEHLWRWRLNSTVQKFQQSKEVSSFIQEAKPLFMQTYAEYQGETSMDTVMAFLMDNRIRRVTVGGSELFRTQFSVKQPFMDVDLINAINCVPHEWRKRHRLYVDVLKHSAPDVAAVAWQRTCIPVSSPYVFSWLSLASQRAYKEARKIMPLPDLMGNDSPSQFGVWFREDLRSYVESVIFSEQSYDRGVLPMSLLEQAWEKHLANEIDASAFLGAAMSIELFARLFMDDLSATIQKFSEK